MEHFPALVISENPEDAIYHVEKWRPNLKNIIGGKYCGWLMSDDPKRKIWTSSNYIPPDLIETLPIDACDQSRKRYVDWQRIAVEEMKRRHLLWSIATDDINNGRPEEIVWLQYGIEPGESEEIYVKRAVKCCTTALATPDGWFDRDSIEPSQSWPEVFRSIVNGAHPNDWLTIVDCFSG